MNNIPLNSSKEGIETISQLVKIALKAHSNNPSPVDIKLDLCQLSADMLMQIDEDTTRILKHQNQAENEQRA